MYANASWRYGEVPLWCPNLSCGYPLVAGLVWGLLYPGQLFFGLVGFDKGFGLFVAFHHILAAVSAYALGRRWGMSAGAGIVCGLVYGFGGYLISADHDTVLLKSGAWVPLVLFLWDRTLSHRSWKNATLTAMAGACLFLGGSVLVAVVTVYAGLLLTALEWRRWSRDGLRVMFLMVCAGLLAWGITMIQFMPSWELGQLTPRGTGLSLEAASQWAWKPRWLLSLVMPYAFGNPTGLWRGAFWGVDLPYLTTAYAGVLPLVFAAIGLWGRWNRTCVWAALLVLFGVLLSLGLSTPVYALAWKLLPGVRLERIPQKYFIAAALGLALLAGWGFDVCRQAPPAKRPKAALSCVLSLWAAFAAFWGSGLLRALAESVGKEALRRSWPQLWAHAVCQLELASATFVAFVGIAVILAAFPRAPRSTTWATAVLAFVIVDLVWHNGRAIATVPSEYYRKPRRVIAWLKCQEDGFRIASALSPETIRLHALGFDPRAAWEHRRNVLMANWGMEEGVSHAMGFVPADISAFRGFIRQLDRQNRAATTLAAYGRMGVKYLIAEHPLPWRELVLAARFDNGVRVYENREWRPLIRIPAPASDAEHRRKPPPRVLCARPHYVRAAVARVGECRVCVADTHYPGWRALVNGVDAPIECSKPCFRSIHVGGEPAVLVMAYDPRSFRFGLAITLASLLGCAVLGTAALAARAACNARESHADCSTVFSACKILSCCY